MSATTTPNDSPIQPLHNPDKSAHVTVPQAPLGNVVNQVPGMGAKALLAKKMANNTNPAFISPTDNLMTPCTQKLSAAKKKHFSKSTKPKQLFATIEQDSSDNEAEVAPSSEDKENPLLAHNNGDENPF